MHDGRSAFVSPYDFRPLERSALSMSLPSSLPSMATKFLLPLLAIAAAAVGVIFFWSSAKSASQSVEPERLPFPTTIEPAAADVVTSDRLGHPPVRRTFTYGPYQFAVTAEDGWETPLATSRLYEGSTLLWQKDLPHQYGPRYALISPQGQVLLVDEFINVASPHALTLIDSDGRVVVQKSFDDIQRALDVSRADLTRQAVSGWWISAPPALSAAGDRASISAGGTALEVDLSTGRLARRADL